MGFRGHLNPQQTVSTSAGSGWIDRHCVDHRQKGPFPCGQSHWKGYSVVLLCVRGIWSQSLFNCSWTAPWCRRCDFVLGNRWSEGSRAVPFFPWLALLEGWKRLLSYISSKEKKKRFKVGVKCGLKWASKGLMLWRGDGQMWHVACVHGGLTHAQTRGCIGFSCGVWERHCSLSLSLFFLSHLLSNGLLSCEHTASKKDLFISFTSWSEKGSLTLESNSQSS